MIANIIANLFLCIESPSLYITPTVCLLLGKYVHRMLLCIVNLGHENVKIIGGCTLAYLTHAKFDSFLDVEDTNQESKIGNIPAATLETKVEMLPAIPSNRKMIFPGYHTPDRKSLLQDTKNISGNSKIN